MCRVGRCTLLYRTIPKLRKPSLQLLCTSLCTGCHEKTSASSIFYKYFAKEQVLLGDDFNVDSVYLRLLSVDIGPDLSELFENVTCLTVRFCETVCISVWYCLDLICPCCSQAQQLQPLNHILQKWPHCTSMLCCCMFKIFFKAGMQ